MLDDPAVIYYTNVTTNITPDSSNNVYKKAAYILLFSYLLSRVGIKTAGKTHFIHRKLRFTLPGQVHPTVPGVSIPRNSEQAL